ncbi:hypothetical protein AURDEDRAFT_161686 [Auricularia subglabra TFB-10046 SS5]|nr:hypothetical protein AURDEDRAFT_161686 [Auricularia subglabra TFB-10046 SS5]
MVALKIFTTALDSEDETRLRHELRIVQQQLSGHHAHIQPFFGLAVHNRSHMILVSPYVKNGDIINYPKLQRTTPRLPLAELSDVTGWEIRVLYTALVLLLAQARSASGRVQSDFSASGMLAFGGEKPLPDRTQLQVVARALTHTQTPHPRP